MGAAGLVFPSIASPSPHQRGPLLLFEQKLANIGLKKQAKLIHFDSLSGHLFGFLLNVNNSCLSELV